MEERIKQLSEELNTITEIIVNLSTSDKLKYSTDYTQLKHNRGLILTELEDLTEARMSQLFNEYSDSIGSVDKDEQEYLLRYTKEYYDTDICVVDKPEDCCS